jgi:hypothetical protein
VKLEEWRSTTNKVERHYFVERAGREVYVVGFNPEMVSPALQAAILSMIEFEHALKEAKAAA